MAVKEIVSVEKHIIMPITLLVGAWGIGGVVGASIGWVTLGMDLWGLFYALGWAIISALLYRLYRKKNTASFFPTALGGCGILSLLFVGWVIFNRPSSDTILAQDLSQILTHFPLVLLPFLYRYYKGPILSQVESKKDIFPFLGTFLSLVTVSNFLVVYLNTHGVILSLLASLIPFIMALGFSTRERNLSFYGSLLWLISGGLPVAYFFDPQPTVPPALPTQQLAFTVAVFLIVLKFRKTRLEELQPQRSPAGASSGGVAKTCGRCGKPVEAAAKAGQRCPHCKAFWDSEIDETPR